VARARAAPVVSPFARRAHDFVAPTDRTKEHQIAATRNEDARERSMSPPTAFAGTTQSTIERI